VKIILAAVTIAALLAGCGSSQRELTTHHLLSDGFIRTWYELRPKSIKAPAPLMVMLDGFGGKALDLIPSTGVQAEAERDGFVVALPESFSGAWNAGQCCTTPSIPPVNDEGFVANIIASLIGNGTALASKVYVVGFSNGGMLTYELGCELANQLAGIAVVDGAWTYSSCQLHKTVRAIVLHQTADPVIPPFGSTYAETGYGDSEPFVGVLESVALWLVSEGCGKPTNSFTTPTAANPVGRLELSCPDGTPTDIDVALGGAHVWPRTPLDGITTIATFFGLRH
jgi:polyhydroxybutyrate depolymerase